MEAGLRRSWSGRTFVFHAGTGCDLGRSLERYCERKGKPLILLEANSVAALAEALATSLPLT